MAVTVALTVVSASQAQSTRETEKKLQRLRGELKNIAQERRKLEDATEHDVAERPEHRQAPPRRRDRPPDSYGSEARNRVNAPRTRFVLTSTNGCG
jgi:hypothetical protein